MTKKSALILALLALTPAPAFAAKGGWINLGLGQASIDLSAADFDDGSFVYTNTDNKDTSLRISGGFNVNDNFAFEAGYLDGGEASISALSNGSGYLYPAGDVSVTAAVTGFSIGGDLYLPVKDSVRLVGRLGILMWDGEATASLGGISATISDSGSDPYIGFGMEADVGTSATFGASITRYNEVDMDIVELGVKFRLGN